MSQVWGICAKKCQFGGCTVLLGQQFPPHYCRWHQKFKIWGPGDQNSGVWYNTFWLQRPQIRGFASYTWAPKPKFLGVTVWGLGAYILGSSKITEKVFHVTWQLPHLAFFGTNASHLGHNSIFPLERIWILLWKINRLLFNLHRW